MGAPCLSQAAARSEPGYAKCASRKRSIFLSADRYARPSCVLLDYRLPDLSGLEVLKRLSVDQPLLPVIFISGHADTSVRELALGSGAIAALQKPLQDDVLLDTIMRALAV